MLQDKHRIRTADGYGKVNDEIQSASTLDTSTQDVEYLSPYAFESHPIHTLHQYPPFRIELALTSIDFAPPLTHLISPSSSGLASPWRKDIKAADTVHGAKNGHAITGAWKVKADHHATSGGSHKNVQAVWHNKKYFEAVTQGYDSGVDGLEEDDPHEKTYPGVEDFQGKDYYKEG